MFNIARRVFLGSVIATAAMPLLAATPVMAESEGSGAQVAAEVARFLVVETLDSETLAEFTLQDSGVFVFQVDQNLAMAVSIERFNERIFEVALHDVVNGEAGDQLTSMLIGEDTVAIFKKYGISVHFFTDTRART